MSDKTTIQSGKCFPRYLW